jgi:hypothetical protein
MSRQSGFRLREIAEAYGVTEPRICQIHAQAILAIKSLLKKEDPELLQAVCGLNLFANAPLAGADEIDQML